MKADSWKININSLDEGINFRVCKLDSKVATDAQNLSFVEFNYLKSSLNQKDPGCDVLVKM